MKVCRIKVREEVITFQSAAEVAEAIGLLGDMLQGMIVGNDPWSENWKYEPIMMHGQYILGVTLPEANKKLKS